MMFGPNTLTDYTNLSLSDLYDGIKVISGEISKREGYDPLDNQNYNTFYLARAMETVDPCFIVSFKRNGADYVTVDGSAIVEGEMKSAKLNKSGITKPNGKFAFHAYAVINNPPEDSYLFYLHENRNIRRIYDVRCPIKVKFINDYLMDKATQWRDAVHAKIKDGKYDVVNIEETVIEELFQKAGNTVYEIVNGSIIATNRKELTGESGGISVFSDHLDR